MNGAIILPFCEILSERSFFLSWDQTIASILGAEMVKVLSGVESRSQILLGLQILFHINPTKLDQVGRGREEALGVSWKES